jgi:hypothetical protein
MLRRPGPAQGRAGPDAARRRKKRRRECLDEDVTQFLVDLEIIFEKRPDLLEEGNTIKSAAIGGSERGPGDHAGIYGLLDPRGSHHDRPGLLSPNVVPLDNLIMLRAERLMFVEACNGPMNGRNADRIHQH